MDVKRLVNRALRPLDLIIERRSTHDEMAADRDAAKDLNLLLALPEEHFSRIKSLLPKSRSQLRQDIFVLSELGFKRNGFFVEFGATNGIDLSNTYLLETEFSWSGILAEPASCWHEQLRSNRSAKIDTDCVWRDSTSILNFKEVKIGEYSTIADFSDADHHQKMRRHGATYSVKTVSLMDLLSRHNAPREIDYLSIDTEGSELDILESFDFGYYNIKVLTCEHNHTPARGKIFDLLSRHGYVRKYDAVSRFDDWYVRG